jgi:hypothetical protein
MKTIREILREKGIVKTDDFRFRGVKEHQESFRRGLREQAETPKQWNKRMAYRVHPYWTENLKYVC